MEIPNVLTKNRLPSLDALRFFAALLVIFDHGGLKAPAGNGVTYFFVLSGFLFSWLFQKEWNKKGKINFKSFYLRRTYRILPAFYVAILFTIAAKLALHLPINYFHALSAATFTGNYYNAFHGHPATGFDSLWSLAVEEQFYLIWPISFVFFMSRGPRALFNFLSVAIVAVCIWRSILYLGFDVNHSYLYNAFDTRFDSLAVGCLLGLIVMNANWENLLKSVTKTGFEPILVLAGIVGMNYVPETLYYSLGFTIEAVLMGILIIQLILLHDHPYWRWLNNKVLIFLGAMSYSMYLYHAWGLAIGYKFKFLSQFGQVLVGTAATICFAYVSYRFIEMTFLNLRYKYEART